MLCWEVWETLMRRQRNGCWFCCGCWSILSGMASSLMMLPVMEQVGCYTKSSWQIHHYLMANGYWCESESLVLHHCTAILFLSCLCFCWLCSSSRSTANLSLSFFCTSLLYSAALDAALLDEPALDPATRPRNALL